MELKYLLQGLREVATSWLALVGYVVVVAAWATRSWLVYRPQRQTRQILAEYRNDSERNVALRSLLGSEPPKGLKRSELLKWAELQAKGSTRVFLLIAYVSTLITILVIVGLAITRGRNQADHRSPVLIKSTPIRP